MREDCRFPLGLCGAACVGDRLRSRAHGRYVIFFRPGEDMVRIERVLHSALDIRSDLVPAEPD